MAKPTGEHDDILGPPPERGNKWTAWTPERMEAFCAEMRKHGRPGIAAKAVGCSKSAVQRKRKEDPDFDAMCREAWEDFQENVIGKVQDFAWEGKPEPIIQDGQIVGVKTVYFTRLQELEARRVVPEYRERKFEEKPDGGEERVLRIAWAPTTDTVQLVEELARKLGKPLEELAKLLGVTLPEKPAT